MSHPRLTFYGAARAVTGSCFRLETAQGQVLIDCGMFQGPKTEKELNYRPFPFDPQKINAVILSHAHIDHCGLLPKLSLHGFVGQIHATSATADLCGVMLPDSAHIQEIEVEQFNRRAAHRHRAEVEPVYTMADATTCLKQFHPEPIGQWFSVLPDLRARLWNAGHLLGSASVEVEITDTGGEVIRLMFSAPITSCCNPIPKAQAGVDYLICESTYGDRDRIDASADRRRSLLADEVRAATHPNGALLIPSFAVERAQELISDLAQLMDEGALPVIPIYVDSPMATKATDVFAQHASALENGATLINGLRSRQLHFTETREQSMALDQVQGFHIVIAASGMYDAGRIPHRLKNWIWREQATGLFTSFQAEGTLGRILQNGARSIRIQGEEFQVRARIRSLDLYSGHADATELVQWIKDRLPLTHDLFLVHGEAAAIDALAARLDGIVDLHQIQRPVLDESFELTAQGLRRLSVPTSPRLAPEKVARLDWQNDLSDLFLSINESVGAVTDERSRDVLIRRLRRALAGEEERPQRGEDRMRHRR